MEKELLDPATKETISIAIAEGVKNDVIIAALGVTDQQIIDVMFEEIDYFNRVETEYFEKMWPQVLQSCALFSEEFPRRDRREMRRRYLQERISELRKHYAQTGEGLEELNKCIWEVRIYLGEIEGLSPEIIERARSYPITKLISNKGLMAKCPFHNDKSPSLNLKKNFYFCHGCGATGDVISFVMKTQNLKFGDAVRLLIS